MDSLIFKKDVKSNVVITLPNDCKDEFYMVRIAPFTHPFVGNNLTPYPYFKVKNNNGKLMFDYTFEYECEHSIYVNTVDNPENEYDYYCPGSPVYKYSVYAMSEDIFNLKILKVDFHAHSNASDGVFPPEQVCAYYRGAGYDVFALTDHYTMDGSVKAKEFYKGIDTDFRLYYGEETHPVATEPHIVNWGCDRSVNSFIYGNDKEYHKQLDDIVEQEGLNKYRNPQTIANCIWRCREIQKAGGMAIIAHPLWKLVTNTVEQEVLDYMFDHKIADAFELCGGNTVEDNNMQVNYYMEFLRSGRDIPIVGDSDSHTNVAYFKEEYTIVLSKDDEKNSIIDAVKNRKVMVYEQNAADTQPRIYSDFRFTGLGHFIVREYFPKLLPQYEIEGNLMKAIADGDKSKIKELEAQKGKIDKLRKELYCKY